MKEESKSFGVASMVTGILSLVLALCFTIGHISHSLLWHTEEERN